MLGARVQIHVQERIFIFKYWLKSTMKLSIQAQDLSHNPKCRVYLTF